MGRYRMSPTHPPVVAGGVVGGMGKGKGVGEGLAMGEGCHWEWGRHALSQNPVLSKLHAQRVGR